MGVSTDIPVDRGDEDEGEDEEAEGEEEVKKEESEAGCSGLSKSPLGRGPSHYLIPARYHAGITVPPSRPLAQPPSWNLRP